MEDTGYTMKDGRHWFVDGWKLFTKSPLMLILGTVIWILLEVLLALLPVIGEILDALIFPVMYGGFLYAIREVDEQRKMKISHFFQGFIDSAKLKPLLILGLLMVFFEIIEAGLIVTLGPFTALILAAPLGLLVISALLYSVPQVMFSDSKPVDAIKSSYYNCGRHISAMITVYLFLILFALLSVVTIGLAMILIIPVTFCALYISYKAIYR
ncbi:hypothetical protein [Methylotuvimicrobium sp. KM1]|uniref:hypothetical protein n=1 Tax=Methylotuvimicrobium sp. KM1 TaxID=3377707 RepID=UPI00384C1EE0